jgi:hypothetical protein
MVFIRAWLEPGFRQREDQQVGARWQHRFRLVCINVSTTHALPLPFPLLLFKDPSLGIGWVMVSQECHGNQLTLGLNIRCVGASLLVSDVAERI